MQDYQYQFIEFLLEHQALKFGEFTLKSGRISPYFFNLGTFNTGHSLARLGEFYAKTLEQSGLSYEMLFGPAYKGIPLVAATSIALYREFGKDMPYCFNRKEAKDHGDGGNLVGKALSGQVVMLDDVITAGTTVRETLAMIKPYPAQLTGIVIAFDRQERGTGVQSAVTEVVEQYNVPVQSIIALEDVIEYLQQHTQYQHALEQIMDYQKTYGAYSAVE